MQMFHKLFSVVLFVQIGQSVIVLAITIVTMAMVKVTITILIGKILYLGIILLQILLFCFLGDQVNHEVIGYRIKYLFKKKM